MKKITISKLFLYRYRFIIGYIILGLAFIALLFLMPILAQNGLSDAEMQSATESYYIGREKILGGAIVDLPYHALQKLSIMLLGFSTYAIKLPSIIIGLVLGFLFILLLNRWFKSNVSLLASCLVVLSTPFLYLAGSGTPLIMLIFWPTLMLWLGSKIEGEKRPKPLYSFMFTIVMLFSLFTPYMIYFAVFCIFFVLSQPHLRFIIKNLPKLPLAAVILILLAGFTVISIGVYNHPETLMELFFAKNYDINQFIPNLATGFAPVFSWQKSLESVFLSPLISLPVFALALIGLFSTTKGFFASRNSIATILIVFCIIITGFNSNSMIFLILPFSILVAHGLKYLLEKWYGLFPENPYARVSAAIPLAILFGFMIIPSLLQYIYGYRYNPVVADEFDYSLEIVKSHINSGQLYTPKNANFYRILQDFSTINIVEQPDKISGNFASLGKFPELPANYTIERIITSPLRENSDIIYLYTYIEPQGE